MAPYERFLNSGIADMSSTGAIAQGGAITAALFLQNFVGAGIAWAHIDLMAWNIGARPGRPAGGEAMAMRALYDLIARRYPPDRQA